MCFSDVSQIPQFRALFLGMSTSSLKNGPKNGRFIVETPIRLVKSRGNPILGNHHVIRGRFCFVVHDEVESFKIGLMIISRLLYVESCRAHITQQFRSIRRRVCCVSGNEVYPAIWPFFDKDKQDFQQEWG